MKTSRKTPSQTRVTSRPAPTFDELEQLKKGKGSLVRMSPELRTLIARRQAASATPVDASYVIRKLLYGWAVGQINLTDIR